MWHSSKSSDRTSYRFYLYRGSVITGRDIIFESSVSDTFLQFPDTLDAEYNEYAWMIVEFDPDDQENGCMGETWNFATGTGFNNPPLAPYDPDPEDGSSSNPLDITLSWDCYDPDGDDLTYDVWWQPSFSDSVLIGDDITAMTIDPGDLEPDKIYYWKIIASEPSGDSKAGPWWRFETIPASNRPPIEPWGAYPPDDATGVPLNMSLSWECSDPEDGPLTYDVFMGLAGGNLYQIGTELSDKFLEVSSLDPSTEYEWQVSATDDHLETTYGPIWAFTTGDGSQTDVYAELLLKRNITHTGAEIVRVDVITARFDSVYAPDGRIHPLQPAAVSCGTFDLVWDDYDKMFEYSDYMAGYFLTPGQTYSFTVTEGGNVPALTSHPIGFPVCAPYITSPAQFSEISLDGFDLEWHTFCSGTVDITILDMGGDSTGVYITTEDDGFYSFTADDLSVIDPMAYEIQVVLIVEQRQNITEVGYDPRSWVWARTLSPRFFSVPYNP